MGDANENKEGKKKYRSTNYTDLGEVYFFKIVCFLIIATITVAYASTFESTLIGMLTTLTGVGFDLHILLKSNYGPSLKWQRKLVNIVKKVIIIICAFVIAYFLIKSTITITEKIENVQNQIKLICKGVIVVFAFIGPVTEYFFNKPNNNIEGRD